MEQNINEQQAALPYKEHEFGLFEAIFDNNEAAIRGLIKFYGHLVNCQLIENTFSSYQYSSTPTPLSYAISLKNLSIVQLLLKLGANPNEEHAIRTAQLSGSEVINQLILNSC